MRHKRKIAKKPAGGGNSGPAEDTPGTGAIHASRWHYGPFPLAVRKEDPQLALEFHSHEFMELVVIENGFGIHFTEQESYPIAAGDVFVIRPRGAHGYSNARNLVLTNILFNPERLGLPLGEIENLRGYQALFGEQAPSARVGFRSRLRLDLKQLTQVEGLVSALAMNLDRKEPGYTFMAKAFFMQIICALSRCYSEQQLQARPSLTRIASAIALIEAGYAGAISLGALAAAAKMSLSSLHRDFKAATGLAPKEYLIRLRAMRGAELLRQGRFNVTETAMQVGFNDSNYFSRQFRAVMKISPRQFLSLNRAGAMKARDKHRAG